MIKGIGTDIIEISRIEKAIKNENFLSRVYTKNEIAYANTKSKKEETLAGIFCAKESIVKAKGTGFKGEKFHNLEILHDENGKPFVNDENILITISHCTKYATATAIIKG